MAEKKANTSKSFEENFLKLEAFSKELQDNKIGIDELVPRMKEALGSIKICKEVLKETKAQLKEINEEFASMEQTSNEISSV